MAVQMSLIATGQILQHVELLLAASRHYGEDPLYEPTPDSLSVPPLVLRYNTA